VQGVRLNAEAFGRRLLRILQLRIGSLSADTGCFPRQNRKSLVLWSATSLNFNLPLHGHPHQTRVETRWQQGKSGLRTAAPQ
jgi:hypothetical protein